ncbi:MAG: transglycosylase SLT domain-containing protein [Leptolyngbya sp. SIO4C1]|nr:transglycosylase SLT domain-containing protein [Leptolyngbya sp. SIO4C1]
MWKQIKDRWPFVALAGVSALSIGMVAAVFQTTEQLPDSRTAVLSREAALADSPSPVLQLATQPPAARTAALSQLASDSTADDIETYRARYLLATDLIDQGRGGSAIELLDQLETDYTALGPYVALKRAQALAAAGEADAAQQTWQQVATTYTDHPAAAEALYELGKTDPAAWDRLLSEFPHHPRSVNVAVTRLNQASQVPIEAARAESAAADTAQANASQLDAAAEPGSAPSPKALLLIVAQTGLNRADYEQYLDQLVASHAGELTPEQWQTVGFGYWEIQRYQKAGEAYRKAPASPTSRYRAARGLQIGGQRKAAIALYQQLAQAFPQAPETATGLLKLADLLPNQEAIAVLDKVINQFPEQAGEALLKRAQVLEALQSPTSAQNAKASILTQHSQSEAAAELRLKNAKQHASKGDYPSALKWAQKLVEANPKSELAAEAGFWAGKWALQLEQPDAAQKAFEQVVAEHPESYFAWRSAVHLGWDVGDFHTVRDRSPEVVLPQQRQPLPAGSGTLQELYRLGQDQDAWRLWQSEFQNLQTPTVAEQFTDGILRLGVNDNLDGIFMLSSLAWRDQAKEQEAYQALKQTPAYWQGVYPFPYAQPIQAWSQQRQLNPLLVTALIRQESRFEPTIRSAVGAAGLMQVMPETADWILTQTGEATADLDNPEDNIRLGTWYLDYTHQEYDNHSLFAVASYNAGPGNVADWIARGGFSNTDEFVEKIPFPETKGYVESVFGGYWNYLRLYNPAIARQVAQLSR